MRVELRRAAGDVECRDAAALQEGKCRVGDIRAHFLGAVRTCVDMAVHAALVAAIPDIELQGVEPSAPDRREGDLLQQRQSLAHARQSSEVCRCRPGFEEADNQM